MIGHLGIPRDKCRGAATLLVAVGLLLFLRILTDDRSAPDSRYSGSLNLSSFIALALIGIAFLLALRHRRALFVSGFVLLWIVIWSAIALCTSGVSTETLREGVRETSVLALAVIVISRHDVFTPIVAARLVQIITVVPGLLALKQLVTGTGMLVVNEARANGTLAHPNSAAMLFAIATVVSLWCYLDGGRRRLDLAAVCLFAAATVATVSIDGVATLAAMLILFGALRKGSTRSRLTCALVAVLILTGFFVSPLGAKRVSQESSTNLSSAESGEIDSSLDTRFYRWKTLLPRWEESPLVGKGLGTTTTTTSTAQNHLNSLLPHNEYIRYFVETGIVGSMLLLAGLGALIWSLVRRRGKAAGQQPVEANVVALGISVVGGCLVNALADNTLLNSPTCYAAVLVIASAVAFREIAPRAMNPPLPSVAHA